MEKDTTNPSVSGGNPSPIVQPAGWLAILATAATILLLATLHVLSPEFSPPWRMVSEYAFGHYAWVLTLIFFSWAICSWALVIAIWSQVHNNAGKVGYCFRSSRVLASRWLPRLTLGMKWGMGSQVCLGLSASRSPPYS